MSSVSSMSASIPTGEPSIASTEVTTSDVSSNSDEVQVPETVTVGEPSNASSDDSEIVVDENMAAVEDAWSEEQLRRRNDDEEIDRFLAVFADVS